MQEYVEAASRKSDLERTELQKDKSGVFIGSSAINPATGEPIPIWVADYVLGSYGSGAIMAVPGHDVRCAGSLAMLPFSIAGGAHIVDSLNILSCLQIPAITEVSAGSRHYRITNPTL